MGMVGIGKLDAHGHGPDMVRLPYHGASTPTARPEREVSEIPTELSEQEELMQALHEELNALSVQLAPVISLVPEPGDKSAEPSRQTVIGQRIAQSNTKIRVALRAVRTMRDSLRV